MKTTNGCQLNAVIATLCQSRHDVIHQLVRFDYPFTDVFVVGTQWRVSLFIKQVLKSSNLAQSVVGLIYPKSGLLQILHFFGAGCVVDRFAWWRGTLSSSLGQEEGKILYKMVRDGSHSLEFRVHFDEVSQSFSTQGLLRSSVFFTAHSDQTWKRLEKNFAIIGANGSGPVQISQTSSGH